MPSATLTPNYPREIVKLDNVGILWSTGTTVPTGRGFSPGCIFIDYDGAAGAQVYVNRGTFASANFVVIDNGVLDLSLLTATTTEINRTVHPATRVIAGGASLTVTQALHDGTTIKLDTAAGTAVTLPAMSGSGSRFRFACTVATSGGSTVITATGAHLFGSIYVNTDAAFQSGTLFTCGTAANGGGSTTITLDGSTTGGRKGDWVEIEDVAANVGIVTGMLNASGTEATPFA